MTQQALLRGESGRLHEYGIIIAIGGILLSITIPIMNATLFPPPLSDCLASLQKPQVSPTSAGAELPIRKTTFHWRFRAEHSPEGIRLSVSRRPASRLVVIAGQVLSALIALLFLQVGLMGLRDGLGLVFGAGSGLARRLWALFSTAFFAAVAGLSLLLACGYSSAACRSLASQEYALLRGARLEVRDRWLGLWLGGPRTLEGVRGFAAVPLRGGKEEALVVVYQKGGGPRARRIVDLPETVASLASTLNAAQERGAP